MLWSSTRILLKDVPRDRIEIVVVLLKCCGTPRSLQISSTIAINYSHFREGVAIGALMFRRILTEFEDLCLVHILSQFLRCFTEPVDLLRLAHIFTKLFFVLMWFEHLDQLSNSMLSLFILLLNCWECYAWNSVVHNVASGFPEALCVALCFPRWSCFLSG